MPVRPDWNLKAGFGATRNRRKSLFYQHMTRVFNLLMARCEKNSTQCVIFPLANKNFVFNYW